MFQFCESDCHRGWSGFGTWTTMMSLQMSYERGFHSQWGGVAAGPVAGRRGEGGEGGDVAVDCMVQQVTPGVPHTVGGVRTNLSIRDTWFCLILTNYRVKVGTLLVYRKRVKIGHYLEKWPIWTGAKWELFRTPQLPMKGFIQGVKLNMRWALFRTDAKWALFGTPPPDVV
jgi:hypothetical protein